MDDRERSELELLGFQVAAAEIERREYPSRRRGPSGSWRAHLRRDIAIGVAAGVLVGLVVAAVVFLPWGAPAQALLPDSGLWGAAAPALFPAASRRRRGHVYLQVAPGSTPAVVEPGVLLAIGAVPVRPFTVPVVSAQVAQLDRAAAPLAAGRGFESLLALDDSGSRDGHEPVSPRSGRFGADRLVESVDGRPSVLPALDCPAGCSCRGGNVRGGS